MGLNLKKKLKKTYKKAVGSTKKAAEKIAPKTTEAVSDIAAKASDVVKDPIGTAKRDIKSGKVNPVTILNPASQILPDRYSPDEMIDQFKDTGSYRKISDTFQEIGSMGADLTETYNQDELDEVAALEEEQASALAEQERILAEEERLVAISSDQEARETRGRDRRASRGGRRSLLRGSAAGVTSASSLLGAM